MTYGSYRTKEEYEEQRAFSDAVIKGIQERIDNLPACTLRAGVRTDNLIDHVIFTIKNMEHSLAPDRILFSFGSLFALLLVGNSVEDIIADIEDRVNTAFLFPEELLDMSVEDRRKHLFVTLHSEKIRPSIEKCSPVCPVPGLDCIFAFEISRKQYTALKGGTIPGGDIIRPYVRYEGFPMMHSHMGLFGFKTTDELLASAIENTMKQSAPLILSHLESHISEGIPDDWDGESPLLVTTKESWGGACAIFYPGLLQTISDAISDDLTIVPVDRFQAGISKRIRNNEQRRAITERLRQTDKLRQNPINELSEHLFLYDRTHDRLTLHQEKE